MMDSDLTSDGGFSDYPSAPQSGQNWWEGPPPPGYTGQWPPPLPAGSSYGPNFGQVVNKKGGTPDTNLPTTFKPDTNLPYGPQPTTPAVTTTDPGGGSTYGQGGGGASNAGFQFPQFDPSIYQPGPSFQPGQFGPPKPFSYGDFSYDSFKAPTLEEAQAQPGYQFALEQGQKALENSAAARGVLRTGGTLKDLFSWGDKFGEQNYGNVFNQDLQGYTTNRNNAFDTYNTNRNNAADAYRTNYGISKDTFDTNYGTAKDAYSLNNQSALDTYDRLFQAQSAAFNPNFQAASLKFSDLYNRDRDKLNALTSLSQYPG